MDDWFWYTQYTFPFTFGYDKNAHDSTGYQLFVFACRRPATDYQFSPTDTAFYRNGDYKSPELKRPHSCFMFILGGVAHAPCNTAFLCGPTAAFSHCDVPCSIHNSTCTGVFSLEAFQRQRLNGALRPPTDSYSMLFCLCQACFLLPVCSECIEHNTHSTHPSYALHQMVCYSLIYLAA